MITTCADHNQEEQVCRRLNSADIVFLRTKDFLLYQLGKNDFWLQLKNLMITLGNNKAKRIDIFITNVGSDQANG